MMTQFCETLSVKTLMLPRYNVILSPVVFLCEWLQYASAHPPPIKRWNGNMLKSSNGYSIAPGERQAKYKSINNV